MCDVGIHFVVSLQMESSLGEYFCKGQSFIVILFKKAGGPTGPCRLTVKNRLVVVAIFSICHIILRFRGSCTCESLTRLVECNCKRSAFYYSFLISKITFCRLYVIKKALRPSFGKYSREASTKVLQEFESFIYMFWFTKKVTCVS